MSYKGFWGMLKFSFDFRGSKQGLSRQVYKSISMFYGGFAFCLHVSSTDGEGMAAAEGEGQTGDEGATEAEVSMGSAAERRLSCSAAAWTSRPNMFTFASTTLSTP